MWEVKLGRTKEERGRYIEIVVTLDALWNYIDTVSGAPPWRLIALGRIFRSWVVPLDARGVKQNGGGTEMTILTRCSPAIVEGRVKIWAGSPIIRGEGVIEGRGGQNLRTKGCNVTNEGIRVSVAVIRAD
ncbi:hypothetical protein L1887_25215 [Cichorium endivia]|nr:hypothetical protein L1887_25215 [Cichorium endivia]